MKMQLSIWLEEPETDDASRIAIKHINDAICLDSPTAVYHEEKQQEREAS